MQGMGLLTSCTWVMDTPFAHSSAQTEFKGQYGALFGSARNRKTTIV